MRTIAYIGKPYPHPNALRALKAKGYRIGILRDTRHAIKNPDVFDFIIDLSFNSVTEFRKSLEKLANHKDILEIEGLVCTYENYIPFKAVTGEVLSLTTISATSAQDCTDKYTMRQAFSAHNPVLSPRFIRVDSIEQLLAFANDVGYPLILKPTNLSKSLLIHTCHDKPELESAYEEIRKLLAPTYARQHITDHAPGIIAEQFIYGEMCSVAAFTDQVGIPYILDGICDLTTAEEVGFQDNFLFSRKLQNSFDYRMRRKILDVAHEGILALSMQSTPAHVEIIYNDTDVKIIEIGARIGGYRPFMYEQSYGVDMLELEARSAVGDPIDTSASFKKYSAVYEFFPAMPGEFVKLSHETPELYAYSSRPAKPGQFIGRSKTGFRAAAIIGLSDDDKRVFEEKCKKIQQIQVVTQ